MLAFLIFIGVIWFVIIFFDTIFKSCMLEPYIRIQNKLGLIIQPLYISLYITRFNAWINRIGRVRQQLLKTWFDIGACVTIIILVPSFILYFVSLYQMIKYSSVKDLNTSLLVPVIPGYTFPVSHLLYYVIIILFCSVIHEMGHALAASRERVTVENFGFSLWGVFAIASVVFRKDMFSQLSSWEKLRVVSAGIWHNIVLSFIALLLWYASFFILSPVYYIGNGVSVLGINELSGLNGPSGLAVGDHIYEIANCKIQDRQSWKNCLIQLSESPAQGFCVPDIENIYLKDSSSCVNSSEYLSFYTRSADKEFCLEARGGIENSALCNETSDCTNNNLCVFPALQTELHRFVTIKRAHKPQVLYEGSMTQLFYDVDVSDFVKKYLLLPVCFAESIVTLLQYIMMFSNGLAVVNVLPGLFLDGTHIIECLVDLALKGPPSFQPRYPPSKRLFIVGIINKIGVMMILGMLALVVKCHLFPREVVH